MERKGGVAQAIYWTRMQPVSQNNFSKLRIRTVRFEVWDTCKEDEGI